MASAQTPNAGEPQRWAPAVREFVQAQQEQQYRRLAAALGLGSDPAKAYAHLTRAPMPLDWVRSRRLEQEVGGDSGVTVQEWQHFDRNVADLYQRYFSLGPPTPYEDPNRYPVMAMIFDGVREALVSGGHSIDPGPILATLPRGDLNATIVLEPETDTPIVFFQHGLYQFLYDFALLAGWAIPPLSLAQLSNDAALAQLARAYTMPTQAFEFLFASLYAYVVDGVPIVGGSPLPRPAHNLFATMLLLGQMERFVMAHELAHLTRGHLDDSPENTDDSKEQEYEADLAGLALVGAVARGEPECWALRFWACDLALTAFNLLERAIGILAFGPRQPAWTSATHPDPLSRRSRLRERVASVTPDRPKAGLAAAGELCGITDALFQRLWELSGPMLLLAYERGARPAPVWSEHIASTFTASN